LIESNIYKLFRYACILTILLISFQSAKSQEIVSDSILQPDTVPHFHSPRTATIMSTLLPGSGQIYNKKYWKVPIIYATFGVLGYFIVYNNNYYLYFKGAYGYRLAAAIPPSFGTLSPIQVRQLTWKRWGKPSFESLYPDLAYLSDESLKTGMDTYRRWRDLNALGFLAFYAFQVIDANVDAHFFNYDISRDLTINVRPGLVINENLMSYAVGLKINVHF
jgi:hypothetical protein